MKKFVYLILSLLFIEVGFSQNQTIQRDYTGAVPVAYFQDGLFYTVNSTTPLPVAITSPTSSTSNYFSKRLTSTSQVDSLEFGFTSRVVTMINHSSVSTDDTLYVSAYRDFRDGKVIMILPGMGTTWDNAWTKVFYKFRTTPTAGKSLEIGVN